MGDESVGDEEDNLFVDPVGRVRPRSDVFDVARARSRRQRASDSVRRITQSVSGIGSTFNNIVGFTIGRVHTV